MVEGSVGGYVGPVLVTLVAHAVRSKRNGSASLLVILDIVVKKSWAMDFGVNRKFVWLVSGGAAVMPNGQGKRLAESQSA